MQTLHTAETCRRPTCTTHHLSILILEYDKFRSPIGRIKTMIDQKNLFGIFILKVIVQYTLPYRCINRIFYNCISFFSKIFCQVTWSFFVILKHTEGSHKFKDLLFNHKHVFLSQNVMSPQYSSSTPNCFFKYPKHINFVLYECQINWINWSCTIHSQWH